MAYVLFISEAKLKDSTAINLNVDPQILLPYVLQAQRIYIEPKIGTDLYQKLEAEITAGSLAGAYKTLVDEYIGDCLPSWAFHMCIPYLRFKTENGNIYSKTSETGTALSTEEAQHLRLRLARESATRDYLHLLVQDVPNRDWILFHIGNTAKDTSGCILVGNGRKQDIVENSRLAMELVIKEILNLGGENINLIIKNK
jgi:hypothetical protein